MKKIILTVAVISTFLSSCSNNGNEATTENAKTITQIKTNNTISFKNVKSGSFVDWRASHLGGVQPRYGKIMLKSINFSTTNEKLTNASVLLDISSFTVESFPEGDEQIGKLTGHLQSPDFFNIKAYPTSKFELTNIEKSTGKFNSTITGNLTILDVTKSITFDANISVSNNEVSIQSEDFSIDRTIWGLIYNTEGTAGVPTNYLISNDIGFTINITATK